MATPRPARNPSVDDEAQITADLGPLLLVLGRAYIDAVSPLLTGIPHGPRGYHVLSSVIRGGHPSQMSLAQRVGIDRTVMTYLIDDLVEAGLVERKLNTDDRRQRRVVLTEKGEAVMERLERSVMLAQQALVQTLDHEERGLLRALLTRAAEALPETVASCVSPAGSDGEHC